MDRDTHSHGLNEWPLMLVLVGMLASMGLVASGNWRRGAFALGACVTLAALLRAVLPPRIAGLLVLRSRWFDMTLLLISGMAIMVLALVVPPSQ